MRLVDRVTPKHRTRRPATDLDPLRYRLPVAASRSRKQNDSMRAILYLTVRAVRIAGLCVLVVRRGTQLPHEISDCGADLVGTVLLKEMLSWNGDFALVGPAADELVWAPV